MSAPDGLPAVIPVRRVASALVQATSMVPVPAVGRVVRTERRVRLGDVSPAGRLRLDALVRYLQDVATDDSRDAGLDPTKQWVVRRTALEVHELPVYEGMVRLATWCGGIGTHWAERRTSITDGERPLVEAATLWVQVDQTTMRPARVDGRFHEIYATAAQGRTVRSRLAHHDPRPEAVAAAVGWPVRFTDFDALGHVNNAAAWSAVEQVLSGQRELRPPLRASLEHRRPIERGVDVRLAVAPAGEGAGVDLWLIDAAGGPLVSGEIRPG
jgi:acyl-ACP thioesterase